jgi:hypothetical protein
MKTLSEVVERNAHTLNNLCVRVDRIAIDVEDLKKPNYDHIFGYIDRQVYFSPLCKMLLKDFLGLR